MRTPTGPIGHDFPRCRLKEDRVRFMAGTEIEDPTFAHFPDATAAELLLGFPVAEKDDGLRWGDPERLIIHFGFGDRKVPDATGDRMEGGYNLKGFRSGIMPPRTELAGVVQQALKNSGVLAGVNPDKTEFPILYPPDDLGYAVRRNLVMFPVTPPDEDIGLLQDGVADSLSVILDRSRPRSQARLCVQIFRDGPARAFRIHVGGFGQLGPAEYANRRVRGAGRTPELYRHGGRQAKCGLPQKGSAFHG